MTQAFNLSQLGNYVNNLGQVNLSSAANGTLAIANGGTGATTASNAFSNIKQNATDTTTGVVELATSAEASAGTSNSVVITPSSLRNGVNASGSAPIYAIRSWVKFNGSGSISISGSGNVSSLTDNGIGLYTVNFSTVMQDTNYSVSVVNSIVSGFNGATTDVSAGNGGRVYTCFMCVSQETQPTTSSVRLSQGNSFYAGDAYDPNWVFVSIVR